MHRPVSIIMILTVFLLTLTLAVGCGGGGGGGGCPNFQCDQGGNCPSGYSCAGICCVLAGGGDGGMATDGGPTADGGMPADGGMAADGGVTEVPFSCSNSNAIVSGQNSGWNVRGQARDFYADFPNVTAQTPVGVLFVWHGVGDSAQNFRNFIGVNSPNSDVNFPFIMITPQGLKLLPIFGPIKPGIEWDLFNSQSGDGNLEAALFEEVLGCLKSSYKIDASRIYCMGFSGGAIAATMLHSRYPNLIGAIVAMSGAWFNDQNQEDAVDSGSLNIDLNWLALKGSDQGTVLQTHGGLNDVYASPQFEIFGVGNGGRVISFENSNQMAKTFLKGLNRTVIDCPHTGGHTNHPSINSTMIINFFKNHRAGVKSSYPTSGLPAGLSGPCTLNP